MTIQKAALVTEVRSPRETGSSIVSHVVLELNALCKATTLDFALSVGELVVRRLCAGMLRASALASPRTTRLCVGWRQTPISR